MKNDAKELVCTFVADKLDDDITRLASFELGTLKNNKVYGCPGRNFDSDDTNLMRAIYCVAFSDTWKGLSMQSLENGVYRGDTINSYSTLFSRPWDKPDKFIERWHPDKTFVEKRNAFNKTCYTVGNMMILPDKKIDGWSINTHRGCHYEWHDYADRFLIQLHKVLTKQADMDLDLNDLVEANKECFTPFYGESGWKSFVDGNLLDYYVDDNYQPILTSKGFTYWQSGYNNREHFFAEANRYIDFATAIIKDRAQRIIEILAQRIQN
nr:hypothetical protein [uncultured Prevotella sp.]